MGSITKRDFVAWGQSGGKLRAKNLSSAERSNISRKAAQKRWSSEPVKMESVRLSGANWENPVFIEEVLTAGTLTDWRDLYSRIVDKPFGATALALSRVLASQTIYGITPLWTGLLCTRQGGEFSHRVSIDADHILPDLKKKFENILKEVEKESGWKTNRIEPPVLILGHFQGVRTGIRQLIRTAPLETMRVRGLKVPTPAETLRIKAWLIVRRNSTRDFLDFVALFDHLGTRAALKALESLDHLYPQEGTTTVSQQLALQLADPQPWDLSQTDLSHYKALKEPYTDWIEVKRRARAAGMAIMQERLQT